MLWCTCLEDWNLYCSHFCGRCGCFYRICLLQQKIYRLKYITYLPLFMWSAMDTIVSNAILQTCFSKPRKNSWTTINTHITNDVVVQHVHHLHSFFSSFFPVSDPLSLQTIVEKVIQSSFLECSSTSLMTWLGDDLSSVVPVKRRLFGNACVHLYKHKLIIMSALWQE